MSHVVTVKAEIRDAAAIAAACGRLKLPAPVQGTAKLFSREATGLAVHLPGWVYPIICDTASGQVKFDDFGGRWGDRKELDRFLQSYAVEKARIEAHRRGHTVVEQQLGNGSIKLTIQVRGGAA